MKESYFNNFLKYLQKKQYLSLLYYFQKHVTCLFTSLQPLHYKKNFFSWKSLVIQASDKVWLETENRGGN